ncbi:hypothetical protein VNI00_011216 [Paramarasmius palmivorus]|uniref:Uncharacterized protein n=1 Tax=Paramarasmius palmivorus TaxID=297713 RepID=A0AAW0CBQ3_9AGAR
MSQPRRSGRIKALLAQESSATDDDDGKASNELNVSKASRKRKRSNEENTDVSRTKEKKPRGNVGKLSSITYDAIGHLISDLLLSPTEIPACANRRKSSVSGDFCWSDLDHPKTPM